MARQVFMLRVGVAALLGALIGLERQVRQRFAGLRTSALVSIGAAAFVALAAATPVESSPTRVAAPRPGTERVRGPVADGRGG